MAERYRKVVKVADLKPNHINGKVFRRSLSDEGIDLLAADIKEHGLRQAAEVNEENTILDGERRWRALVKLGIDETEVVVVPGVVTEEQIEDYVLRAYVSTRDPSIEERVGLFRLAQGVLQRKHGRERGRPEKMVSNDTIYLSSKKIGEAAAKQAGFNSYETAVRAEKVLREADDDLREALCSGKRTINNAYDEMQRRKRPAKPPKRPANEPAPPHEPTPPETSESSDGHTGGPGQPPEQPASDQPGNQGEPMEQEPTVATNPYAPVEQAATDEDEVAAEEEAGPEAEEGNSGEMDPESIPDIRMPGERRSRNGDIWAALSELSSGIESTYPDALRQDYDRAIDWRENLTMAMGQIETDAWQEREAEQAVADDGEEQGNEQQDSDNDDCETVPWDWDGTSV
jgi:hypothetical protein